MRRLLLADVHLTDRPVMGRPRLEVGLRVMDQAYRVACGHQAQRIVILGDLLDSKIRISIDVLYELRAFFAERPKIIWEWLRGNHEAPDRQDPEKSIITFF